MSPTRAKNHTQRSLQRQRRAKWICRSKAASTSWASKPRSESRRKSGKRDRRREEKRRREKGRSSLFRQKSLGKSRRSERRLRKLQDESVACLALVDVPQLTRYPVNVQAKCYPMSPKSIFQSCGIITILGRALPTISRRLPSLMTRYQ